MRLLLALAFTIAAQSTAQRLVLIDQDGSGPGGSNQMAMMVLLQSPQAHVLGITMVSGNAWEPEEVQHTLRMLELIHRTDISVVPGAIFPLLRTEAESLADRDTLGTQPWYGAWGDLAAKTSRQPYHSAMVLPPMDEGQPTTKPVAEDAAHFLIRQVRHEFNFWFDPEAAHITLRAPWPRIDLTTVDISVKTHFTKEMMADIAAAHTPAADYIAKYTGEFYYLWDELAAAAWLDPKIITAQRDLYVDVDINHGPNYGDTLTWTAANKPKRDMPLVHVQQDLDSVRFNKLFVDLMKAPPATSVK